MPNIERGDQQPRKALEKGVYEQLREALERVEAMSGEELKQLIITKLQTTIDQFQPEEDLRAEAELPADPGLRAEAELPAPELEEIETLLNVVSPLQQSILLDPDIDQEESQAQADEAPHAQPNQAANYRRALNEQRGEGGSDLENDE